MSHRAPAPAAALAEPLTGPGEGVCHGAGSP